MHNSNGYTIAKQTQKSVDIRNAEEGNEKQMFDFRRNNERREKLNP